MKAYKKAALEVEEFILNADIATGSETTTNDPSKSVSQQIGGGGLQAAGIEFEIAANGNDEV
ncbi:MAG TPA: hypothetical protein DDY98_03150 [Ruminococcaceae bacterium]|nr:hypothetical protein [Oscillospiraceae bacterium]